MAEYRELYDRDGNLLERIEIPPIEVKARILANLEETDKAMPRSLEDVISVLKQDQYNALSPETKARVQTKKDLRAELSDINKDL